MSAQAYDLLLQRATLALVVAKPAGSPWSAIERRDDPDAPFVLRLGVDLTDAQLAAMYPPPPDDDEVAEVEAAEPAPKKPKAKAKVKPKGGA